MLNGTRTGIVGLCMVALVGCHTSGKYIPPKDPVKRLEVSPPKPVVPAATATPRTPATTPVVGSPGTMNVPNMPTSGGTLPLMRPDSDMPAPVVLPTVPITPSTSHSIGMPVPPAPAGVSGVSLDKIDPPNPSASNSPIVKPSLPN